MVKDFCKRNLTRSGGGLSLTPKCKLSPRKEVIATAGIAPRRQIRGEW